MRKAQIVSLIAGAMFLCLAGCSAKLSPADQTLLKQAVDSSNAAAASATAAESAAARAEGAASAAEASAGKAVDAASRAENAANRADAAAVRADAAAQKAESTISRVLDGRSSVRHVFLNGTACSTGT